MVFKIHDLANNKMCIFQTTADIDYGRYHIDYGRYHIDYVRYRLRHISYRLRQISTTADIDIPINIHHRRWNITFSIRGFIGLFNWRFVNFLSMRYNIINYMYYEIEKVREYGHFDYTKSSNSPGVPVWGPLVCVSLATLSRTSNRTTIMYRTLSLKTNLSDCKHISFSNKLVYMLYTPLPRWFFILFLDHYDERYTTLGISHLGNSCLNTAWSNHLWADFVVAD